jgi:hypothetical protein
MAPSFEQLDPEQADYDGEEEIDFSGRPQSHHSRRMRGGMAMLTMRRSPRAV